ncbi:MAG: potassium channel family protein [Alphaproteobacteria bacterium]|nr:potassium channel family protein [Alphaproteobacteria bacterium]MBU0792356.1 potassium channel family protein [Alphaproteobacteria bacterium]MBU0877577.1 potassium channel family protein [Alphaproteobacteria bacterium]MBU1770036.1 potassium channel family protein [Alphaproteobacteria bacterium]
MTLITQLAIATLIVGATVIVHLIGLAMLLAVLRRYRRGAVRSVVVLRNSAAILVGAFGLFALHAMEIWIWAGAFFGLGAFIDFELALYFSTSTYVTIGYGDVVLPPGLRILGAIEGASGIILIGWSTAFFFSIVDRMKLLERDFDSDHGHQPAPPPPEGGPPPA